MAANELVYIKFSDEFQSFVDVSLIGLLIYLTSEVYYGLFQPAQDEMNLSVFWCCAILIYGLNSLLSLTFNYLYSSEGSICLIFAGTSFVTSLLAQLADERIFDFGLKRAFVNFSTNIVQYMNTSDIYQPNFTTYSQNEFIFSCFLALLSGLIGGMFFFPAFRLAKIHLLALKYTQSIIKRFFIYINFILPLVISLCWFKSFTKRSISIELDEEPKLSQIVLVELIKLVKSHSFKLYLIVILFFLRLVLYKTYAQAYLNTAYENATILRRSANKISSKKYISTVSQIYQYYGVVANQYILPLVILIFLTFLMKTMGNLNWCDLDWCKDVLNTLNDYLPKRSQSNRDFSLFKSIDELSKMNNNLNDIKNIFSPTVWHSIIGYLTFWSNTVWFAISCIGLLYYQYVDRALFYD